MKKYLLISLFLTSQFSFSTNFDDLREAFIQEQVSLLFGLREDPERLLSLERFFRELLNSAAEFRSRMARQDRDNHANDFGVPRTAEDGPCCTPIENYPVACRVAARVSGPQSAYRQLPIPQRSHLFQVLTGAVGGSWG